MLRLATWLGAATIAVATGTATAAAPAGTLETVAGGPGRGPATEVFVLAYGMATFDRSLYLVSPGYHVVRAIDLDTGMIRVVAGTMGSPTSGDGGPATEAQFDDPINLAIDSSGRIYVSDPKAARIRRIDLDGTISTYAGTGEQGSDGDGGAASEARVVADGLAFDTSDNLYVAEPNYHRVRRIRPDGIIEAFAGTGERGFQGDGAQAADALLDGPYEVAADPEGNIYISDVHNGRIRKVDPGGVITTIGGGGLRRDLAAEGYPALEKDGFHSLALAWSLDGGLYVGEGRVLWRIDSTGILRRVAGDYSPGPGGDGGPAIDARIDHQRGLAIDDVGNVYLGEYFVRKIDTAGIIHTIGGTALNVSGDGRPAVDAQLASVNDIELDRAGGFYLADWFRIRHVGSDGVIDTVAGREDVYVIGDGGPATDARMLPRSLTTHPITGELHFVDGEWSGIRKITADGTVEHVAARYHEHGFSGDGGPALNARIHHPESILFSPDGELYIADTQNRRVRKIDLTGVIRTIAGTGKVGTTGDGGPATEATLSQPKYLALDRKGNLYVAGDRDYRVRRITPDGVIDTVVGTGVDGFSGDGGPATEAQIGSLAGIEIDLDDSLLLGTNSRIRRVDPNGIIATIAGVGQCCIDGDGKPALESLMFPNGFRVDPEGSILFINGWNMVRRMVRPLLCPLRPGEEAEFRDGDGDGVGDRCDPCTDGSSFDRGMVRLLQIASERDDRLVVNARFAGPADGAINPAISGMRVVLKDANGVDRFDATLPASDSSSSSEGGWVSNASGTRFVFAPAPSAGQALRRAVVRIRKKGQLDVRIDASSAALDLGRAPLPLRLSLAFEEEAARGPRCAEHDFDGGDCRLASGGNKLICR